uniref:Uncharacterized protein n=1 Tax=Molossus molossus TaxID=27622 RepID=A0A7J8EED7_MOLMO|nr:hypothetical protein HJG59_008803 [Molossus molossus]
MGRAAENHLFPLICPSKTWSRPRGVGTQAGRLSWAQPAGRWWGPVWTCLAEPQHQDVGGGGALAVPAPSCPRPCDSVLAGVTACQGRKHPVQWGSRSSSQQAPPLRHRGLCKDLCLTQGPSPCLQPQPHRGALQVAFGLGDLDGGVPSLPTPTACQAEARGPSPRCGRVGLRCPCVR